MSALSTADIRASRSLERPTSSGFARGRGSAANAALQANRPNAAVRIRSDTIEASRFELCGPLIAIAFSSEVDTGSHEENASNKRLEPGSDSIRTDKALAGAYGNADGETSGGVSHFCVADHALTRACLRGTEFPRIIAA
jgi:hypothetical protein